MLERTGRSLSPLVLIWISPLFTDLGTEVDFAEFAVMFEWLDKEETLTSAHTYHCRTDGSSIMGGRDESVGWVFCWVWDCVGVCVMVKDMINMQCRQSDRGVCVIRAVLCNRGLYNILICILIQPWTSMKVFISDSMSVHSIQAGVRFLHRVIELFFICVCLFINSFLFFSLGQSWPNG